MKSLRRWELAAALGAAVVMLALGGEARAEKLRTERAAELRSSPGDDSQVVKKVGKGKSLVVVKRLGTWVQVEYEGRTGWVRRTALSAESVSEAEAEDEKTAKSEKAEKKKKSKKRKKAEAEEEDPDDADVAVGVSGADAKPAAEGAKRTAERKKAERRKSRRARKQEQDGKKSERVAAAEAEEEPKPKRNRSTWGSRSSRPGGPLKVEIQALSVQAFAESDGTGKVVFTLSEGERVRVIARGENRWLLVENSKKQKGWIPAVAVRDNGRLPDARKDAAKVAGDGASDATEAPEAEEEELGEPRKKSNARKTKVAAAASSDDGDDGDASGDEGDDRASGDDESDANRDDGAARGDDADAELGTSATDDDLAPRRKDWTVTGMLRGGFTSVGMDVSPTAGTAQDASYSGPTATLSGEFSYRIRPKIAILGELNYDWATALGGLGVTPAGGAELDGGSAMSHRIGASVGAGYGKRMVGSLRLGYQYAIFQISDLENLANWPRETTSGPTAGLGLSYAELAGTKLGVKLGVDALLFGSRTQTEGLREGPEFDSMTALAASLRVDYPVGQHLLVDGGYRFGYTKASWTGASERNAGAMDTDRTDTAHEISIGVGWRL